MKSETLLAAGAIIASDLRSQGYTEAAEHVASVVLDRFRMQSIAAVQEILKELRIEAPTFQEACQIAVGLLRRKREEEKA